MRSISLSPEVALYIESSDDRLAELGVDKGQIEYLYAFFLQILYFDLPRGRLSCLPVYLGCDPEREGASLFSFQVGGVLGIYSACPRKVHLIKLELDLDEALRCAA